MTATLDPPAIEPDAAGVLRYMGYPAAATPDCAIVERVERVLHAARGKLRPRAACSIYPVDLQTSRTLTLGGATFTGPVGEFLTGAQSVAVFVATAGPETAAMAEEAIANGDRLTAFVYNALGSHVADAAAEQVLDRLRHRIGPAEAITLPYSPGYCGIPLAQQRTLFELVDAAGIGVELLPTYIMKPLKSVSGLAGIGPKDAVAAFGNPCDKCSLVACRMRR